MVLSLVKSTRETLEKGPLSGWGQIVNVVEKHGRFLIGYSSSARQSGSRKQIKFNLVRFNSAGFQDDHIVAVISDSSYNKKKAPSFVRRFPPGFKLSNWTTSLVPIVYLKKCNAFCFLNTLSSPETRG